MVTGDATDWDQLFPYALLPNLLDLVVATWEEFEKPAQDALEPPISRRFRSALKRAKSYKKLPFLLMREDPEDEFENGAELGRKDLTFYPTHHEEVYFTFECKRLNALVGGKIRALASEYVTDGMNRFVTGQYARTMKQGGMIGYVLDGQLSHAMGLVENNIQNRHEELGMESSEGFRQSRLRKGHPQIRETEHKFPRTFLMHHIFLG